MPTDNAAKFVEWVSTKSLPPDAFAGVRFTVFGCGDHDAVEIVMTKHYTWNVWGTGSNQQSWKTSGVIALAPSAFPSIFEVVMAETFKQLTHGKAVYGQPGVGCVGPYDIDGISIEQAKES